MEERLRIVDAYLQEFEARPVDSTVKPQPLFTVRSGLGCWWGSVVVMWERARIAGVAVSSVFVQPVVLSMLCCADDALRRSRAAWWSITPRARAARTAASR